MSIGGPLWLHERHQLEKPVRQAALLGEGQLLGSPS